MHNQSNPNNNKFLYLFGIITLVYIVTTSYIMIETEKKEREKQQKLELKLAKEKEKLLKQQLLKEEKEKQEKKAEEQKEESKQFNKQLPPPQQQQQQQEYQQMNLNQDAEFKDEESEQDEDVIINEEENALNSNDEGDQEEDEGEGEEESIEQFSMFGVSIEKLMEFQRQDDAENGEDIEDQDESTRVPIVLSFMLDRIKNLNGFETEGLFRINGNLKLVEQLATDGFDPFSDDLDTNVHTWASLLKKWIRDLPEPIIPFELNQTIVEICNNNNIIEICNNSNNNNNCSNSNNSNSELVDKIITSILEMIKPDDHKYVLCRIGLFFGEMLQDENVEKTKMNIENLSKIITPSLFKPNNLLANNNSNNNNTSSSRDGSTSPNHLQKFVTTLDFSSIMSKQKKETEFVQLLLTYFKNEYFRKSQLEVNFKNSSLETEDQEQEVGEEQNDSD